MESRFPRIALVEEISTRVNFLFIILSGKTLSLQNLHDPLIIKVLSLGYWVQFPLEFHLVNSSVILVSVRRQMSFVRFLLSRI